MIDNSLCLADANNVSFFTQKAFQTKKGKIIIPDISIFIDNILCLIEVKDESQLNTYRIGNIEGQNEIDQIDLYNQISINGYSIQIHTLTIDPIDKRKCNSITWQDVYNLFDRSSVNNVFLKGLIMEFNLFLEKREMAFNKVEKEINIGVQSLINLLMQLKRSLKGLGYKPKSSTGETSSGYYVEKDKKFKVWIGMDFRYNNIKIQVVNKELIEFLKERNEYPIDPNSSDYILISDFTETYESYFSYSTNQQFEAINLWISTSLDKLDKFITSTGEEFKLLF